MPPASKRLSDDVMTPRARLSEGGLLGLLGYQLAQAAIITSGHFLRRVGRPLGIGPVEFTLLHLVKENPSVTPTRLARALAISLPAITAWIAKLEQRGLVERERSATDRRSQHMRVTAAGEALVTQALQDLLDEERATLNQLSTAEQAMLLELLRKVSHTRST
jgi:DNA-binding MarR family transcriptional regulator